MNEIFGKHRQDINEVRRLCLICHGLDLTSDKLFNNSTYKKESNVTKEVFQNLVSGNLLNLAVAIRINIYQGKFEKQKDFPFTHCGYYYDDENRDIKNFTLKDVCDKIIHADTISKVALPPKIMGDSKMTIQLQGKHRKRVWTLDLNLERFVETVLNYLDQLEKDNA